MAKRNKSYMNKIRHNCPTCQSSYTLLETHLTRKDLTNCQTNCKATWERIIHKYCQEKVLSAELEQEQEKSDKNHGSN
ncbi:MAG: hypothetical protein I3273_03780 [Candidatus Moeniiplasma glomeromycotorum]|nr:hypothetical protein [Candidatus Moeniiplasma glomeromycotorum]MCE8169216.1 hypothetical protein [Candidatus Moeniiplasma glomeromycotorum]